MDSLSQVVLGASVGGAVMGRTLGRSALLGGALLGTLPDLDVLIDYGDAVANFTEHRGFSHSLLVLLPVSLLLAWVLQRWRPAITLWRWWAFTGLCLLTHGQAGTGRRADVILPVSVLESGRPAMDDTASHAGAGGTGLD